MQGLDALSLMPRHVMFLAKTPFTLSKKEGVGLAIFLGVIGSTWLNSKSSSLCSGLC